MMARARNEKMNRLPNEARTIIKEAEMFMFTQMVKIVQMEKAGELTDEQYLIAKELLEAAYENRG